MALNNTITLSLSTPCVFTKFSMERIRFVPFAKKLFSFLITHKFIAFSTEYRLSRARCKATSDFPKYLRKVEL
jgi:hypothetical protein